MIRIILVVLFTDKDQIIATNSQQPFFIKDDLKRFRDMTTGHVVVMGRKTYESIGKPLLKRENIILSRSLLSGKDLTIVRTISDLKKIIEHKSKVYIIGGGQVYQQFFDIATELEVTRVYATPPDISSSPMVFPPISSHEWKQTSKGEIQKSLARDYFGISVEVMYRFETYYRKSPNT